MTTAFSVSKGWAIWIKALREPRSLADAAAWMYRLNVFARSLRRHPIVDQIYGLKNDLIRYLYQHEYADEVLPHNQKRLCHSCGGTGEYWTGEECFKCDGTGIFAVTELYAFRFLVDGQSYKWHQLKKMVDYPITLTNPQISEFVAPRRDEAVLTLEDAWLGCCVVWWSLLAHRRLSGLLLLSSTWAWLKHEICRPFQRWYVWWTFALRGLRRRWSAILDRSNTECSEDNPW